jgi:FkbM family methyltransferase
MSLLNSILRQCLPHGLIAWHRRLFRLRRLGLFPPSSDSKLYEWAIDACGFDLWPRALRGDARWTLIDVGASEGDFLRAATMLGRPEKLIAFEPLPTCAKMLTAMLRTLPRAELHQIAVGSVSGEIELNCTGNGRMTSILPPKPGIERFCGDHSYEVSHRLKVPVVRLGEAISSDARVGLLKIDVQGYELKVLRGATRTLTQTDALLIEINYKQHYHGADRFEDIQQFLNGAGFRLCGVSAPYVDNHCPLWADAMDVPNRAGD